MYPPPQKNNNNCTICIDFWKQDNAHILLKIYFSSFFEEFVTQVFNLSLLTGKKS